VACTLTTRPPRAALRYILTGHNSSSHILSDSSFRVICIHRHITSVVVTALLNTARKKLTLAYGSDATFRRPLVTPLFWRRSGLSCDNWTRWSHSRNPVAPLSSASQQGGTHTPDPEQWNERRASCSGWHPARSARPRSNCQLFRGMMSSLIPSDTSSNGRGAKIWNSLPPTHLHLTIVTLLKTKDVRIWTFRSNYFEPEVNVNYNVQYDTMILSSVKVLLLAGLRAKIVNIKYLCWPSKRLQGLLMMIVIMMMLLLMKFHLPDFLCVLKHVGLQTYSSMDLQLYTHTYTVLYNYLSVTECDGGLFWNR
jgi:hypothetical protein